MSLWRNNHRRQKLYFHKPAMDMHCDREPMCESADGEIHAIRVSRSSNVRDERSDIPSARLQSLRIAEAKSDIRKPSGIIAKLATKVRNSKRRKCGLLSVN